MFNQLTNRLIKFSILCYLVLLVLPVDLLAKPNIVTTILPVKSIVEMLVGEYAEVSSINTTAGCPHHYHAKPSDLARVNQADIIIYIDERFDGFISSMLRNYTGHKLQISAMANINFTTQTNASNTHTNWHFWLDLDNVQALQEILATELARQFPALQPIITVNLAQAKESIANLIDQKNSILNDVQNIIVIGESLEHFFNSAVAQGKVTYYPDQNISLQKTQQLARQLQSINHCLVIDQTKPIGQYTKFSKHIIQLDSENWQVDLDQSQPRITFAFKYRQMLDLIQQHCR
jgi:zinc transport system substrate-binding protein